MEDKKPLVKKLESVEKYLRLLGGPPQTSAMRAGLVNLKSGEEIGEHSTDNKEESLVILSGEAEVFCENYPVFKAPANSLVYIPPNTKHNIKNIGSQALSYVYITASVKT